MEGEPSDVLQTFQLLSDGKTLYWLYAQQTPETVTHPVTGEKVKHHPLFLQALNFKVAMILLVYQSSSTESSSTVSLCQGEDKLTLGQKVLIQRSYADGDKNSEMVKVLVRASPSYSSSALSSLLGISKDDTCKFPWQPEL